MIEEDRVWGELAALCWDVPGVARLINIIDTVVVIKVLAMI